MINTLLIIVFVISLGSGAYQSEVGLRKMRSHRNYADIIFEWTDYIPSGFRNEGLIWVAPTIHFIALTIIALASLINIFQPITIPGYVSVFGIPASILYVAIYSSSIFIIAYLWGSVLAVNPIYKPVPSKAHFALSNEGILYAGYLFVWNVFTHFTVSESNGIIRLWSASAPRLVLFAFLPVDVMDQRVLAEHLSQYLPSSVSSLQKYSWPVWYLPVAMLGTSIAVVIISILLLLNTGVIGLLATSFLANLFAGIGGREIMRIGYGSIERIAKLQEEPPPESVSIG